MANSQDRIHRQRDPLNRIYISHYQGAWMRVVASLFMWIVALAAYLTALITKNNMLGISAGLAFLILMNPPVLQNWWQISNSGI